MITTGSEPQDDRAFMEQAIALGRLSVSEPGRVSPKVGAVVARNGIKIGEACRGGRLPGEHAEYILLDDLDNQPLAGATLFTTLEPCTKRNPPKRPCFERIIERKLARVVIGILDPNDDIRGQGVLSLRRAGVEVALFDSDLMAEIEEMNRDFTALRESNAAKRAGKSALRSRFTREPSRRFASDEFVKVLARHAGFDRLVVDDGVMLDLRPHTVDLAAARYEPVVRFDPSDDPPSRPVTRAYLEGLVEAERPHWLTGVHRFLHGELPRREADDDYGVKVGLIALERHVAEVNRNLTIRLETLSHWMTNTFNRPMLESVPEDELGKLRVDCLNDLFRGARDSHHVFRFPSALFIELAVISSDDKLLIAKKLSEGPVNSKLAAMGRPWTCTIEQGFRWNRDVCPDGSLDVLGAANHALRDELGVPFEGVDRRISLYGVALEGPHLNTAVLGVAEVDMPASELGLGRYFEKIEPIDLFRASLELDEPPTTRNGRWHPTGRLRLLLSLKHRGFRGLD